MHYSTRFLSTAALLVIPYRYFKVHHFLCYSGDGIVEAEAVFANVVCGEDKVSLALLLPI